MRNYIPGIIFVCYDNVILKKNLNFNQGSFDEFVVSEMMNLVMLVNILYLLLTNNLYISKVCGVLI